jgi:hypothetical protein
MTIPDEVRKFMEIAAELKQVQRDQARRIEAVEQDSKQHGRDIQAILLTINSFEASFKIIKGMLIGILAMLTPLVIDFMLWALHSHFNYGSK